MTGSTEASLTVVIPHLNGPDGLAICLKALAAEREASGIPFTVHVVDNGSHTLPEAVCAPYPFVTLMTEAEPGPGPARNHGARAATSDILGFIDADCVPRPGWVSRIVEHFSAHPETGVIGGDVRIARDGVTPITATEAYESVFGYRMRLYVERDNYTGTGNMAVRRTVFESVGDFAGISIAEDMDWGRRATAQGVRINFLPEMIIETPARTSFAELTRKWDRHIGHEFAKVTTVSGRAKWLLKAAALIISPLAGIPKILTTDLLQGGRERWLALRVLVQIRAYRAKRMLGLLVGAGPSSMAAWRGQ
ncbi:MAG: glycosyltransferase [Pseudomonadota bacterium]